MGLGELTLAEVRSGLAAVIQAATASLHDKAQLLAKV